MHQCLALSVFWNLRSSLEWCCSVKDWNRTFLLCRKTWSIFYSWETLNECTLVALYWKTSIVDWRRRAFNKAESKRKSFQDNFWIYIFNRSVVFCCLKSFIKFIFYLPGTVEYALMYKLENPEPRRGWCFTSEGCNFPLENSWARLCRQPPFVRKYTVEFKSTLIFCLNHVWIVWRETSFSSVFIFA